MKNTLIKHATLVNEGKIQQADLRIVGQRIEKISSDISAQQNDLVVDAQGLHLLPGMIDDQVHFREPGLTHKGTIASESRAAVAGGITSFMEMPNVNPATTTLAALANKYDIAAQSSHANYAFYLGATENNLEEIKRLDPNKHCGVKVFMGASTGNLLVEDPVALESIFRESPVLIVTHCESGAVIAENLKARKSQLKLDSTVELALSIHDHSIVRDHQACYASSSLAVGLAKKHKTNLHVLHLTTAKELSLFTAGPVENKRITAEACVHHLWFSDQDYAEKGNLIKCNPAIKTAEDCAALIDAVNNDIIDIIATDHAPHTLAEKQLPYEQAPAGLPLVEHALLSLFDLANQGKLSLSKLVEKTAHNPAIRYGIQDRGFLREGCYADLVLVDTKQPNLVRHNNTHYLCGWTPFDGHTFSASIIGTWVNGHQVYDHKLGITSHTPPSNQWSMPLVFNR